MLENIKIIIGAFLIAISMFLVPFVLGWLINTGILNLLQFLLNNIIQADYRYNVWVGGLIWQVLNTFVFYKKP